MWAADSRHTTYSSSPPPCNTPLQSLSHQHPPLSLSVSDIHGEVLTVEWLQNEVQLVVSYISPEADRNAEPLFWLEMVHMFGANGGYSDSKPIKHQRPDVARKDARKKQRVAAGAGEGGQAVEAPESGLAAAVKVFVAKVKVFTFSQLSTDERLVEAAKQDIEASGMKHNPSQLIGQELRKMRQAGEVYLRNEQKDEWGELSLHDDVVPFCEGVVRTVQEASGGGGCHVAEVMKRARHAPKMGDLTMEVVQRAMDALEELSRIYSSDRGEYKLVPGGG